jgi:hypothetical protein
MSTRIFANSAILDATTHEKAGFHEGWSQCADQLATLVIGLG